MESLPLLTWELQESPGLALALVQALRADPALEHLGCFPQQKEGCLPKGPPCTGAGLLLAPTALSTSGQNRSSPPRYQSHSRPRTELLQPR